MKALLVGLLLAISLTACGHTEKIIVPPESKVNVNQEALQPCAPLEKLPELTYTDLERDMQLVLGTSAVNAIIYSTCKNKQNDSIKLLKEFANIKDEADAKRPIQTP